MKERERRRDRQRMKERVRWRDRQRIIDNECDVKSAIVNLLKKKEKKRNQKGKDI